MKIANPSKFENTILAEPITASATNPTKQKQNAWKRLCTLYDINHAELNFADKSAWAQLCQKFAEDVLPGLNQAKKVGRKPIRTAADYRQVYEMYSIAKAITRFKKDHLYFELARFEGGRTGANVTPEMIHNIVNEGRKLNSKNPRAQKSLGEIFTQPSTKAEGYDAQDLVMFLSSLANLDEKSSLPIADDPRNKAIYAKPISKRIKQG